MARNRQEIKDEMTAKFMANMTMANLYGFEIGALFRAEFSKFSLENIIFDIISFFGESQEKRIDRHELEMDEKLLNQKNGRVPWYAFMARQFQYGFDLIPDTDLFDNDGFTPEQIEISKIIKFAAVEEKENGLIVIKVATEVDGELSPLSPEQYDAVKEYFKEIRPGGVTISIINFEADRLFINLQIERDPLVLDGDGMDIVSGTYPVLEAIDEFLRELPFNGQFVIAHFVDKLQNVRGVKIPTVFSIETSWINPATSGYGVPEPIIVKKIPVSGYFKVEQFGISQVSPPTGISYVV